MKYLLFVIFIIAQNTFAQSEFKFSINDLPKDSIRNPVIDKNLKSKIVVIDFWASWCGPCVESFPFYQEILEKHKDRIVWIAMNEDSSIEEAQEFLYKHTKENFHFYFDSEAKFAKKFNILGIPHLFALDQNGTILFEHKGFSKKEKDDIQKKFSNAISKQEKNK